MRFLTAVFTSCALTGFLGVGPAAADSLTQVTSPSAQAATDSISWSKLGADQTVLNAGVVLTTTKGVSVQILMTAPNAVISRVCLASPCSWTGQGFSAGDTLLWTSDASNGGVGPVRVAFASPFAGAGAYVQADGPGSFTAKIEAFNGNTSLGYFTSPSNSQGAPLYMGLLDKPGANITSVMFSLTSASTGLTTDFALDTVSLTAATGTPAVTLTPTSLKFANQIVGSTSGTQSITLKNTGNASLAISAAAASGDFKETNTCGSAVAAGASCTFSVSFHPSASGTRTGTLTVSDNAKNSPQSAALTGTGIAPAVHLSPTSIVFPAQLIKTQSAAQTVTFSNTGSAPLTFSSIAISGDFKESNRCSSPLAVNASCAIAISFAPTATGTRTGALKITDTASGSPQQVTLSGTGSDAKLSATKLTFAATSVGKASAAQSVTLTNASTSTLSITSIALTGTNASDFTDSKTCGSSLSAGASCSVTVVFQPKAKGSRSATLAFTDNGGASPQSVALSGNGQ